MYKYVYIYISIYIYIHMFFRDGALAQVKEAMSRAVGLPKGSFSEDTMT